ncbi:MAG: peroxide stress protein YaaA, partial [Micrococcales bacterium]
IPATDLIPNYRLSASTSLPGLSLKQEWSVAHEPIWKRLENHAIIDLRSKSYAELAPIPDTTVHHWVEVVSRESGGSLKALNHFNKKAKGQLIGAILRSATPVESIDDLAAIASSIGMELVANDKNRYLLLVTEQVVR